ncbi:hypothetical protein [Devosia sediminis]|uniref:Uncharacterized protein n=1 Tax=Devosia sediminis TaxID=2798801 RepID=A0A934IXU5_9HYPH|nr:hypothetical protein [Devosia sediminis]MBJ3784220.1 hypothetical protein [Devosia sediminis]
MTQTFVDPDPYAELDYRADAGELSEEFRKPIRIARLVRPGQPATQTRLSANPRRNRV